MHMETSNEIIITPPQSLPYNPDQSFESGITVIFLYIAAGIAFILFYFLPMWKIFVKTGHKGWESLIQGHNTFVMFKMIGKPGWWYFFTLIPLVNLALFIYLIFKLTKVFGKSTLFAIMTLFFLPVGLYILAFGKAQYKGAPSPSSSTTPSSTPPSSPPHPQQPPTVIPTPTQ